MLWEATDRMVVEELQPAERDELRAICRSPLLLKCFRLLRSEVEAAHNQIAKADLSQMEGIHKAVKLQGVSQGLGRSIDFFNELITPEIKP